MRQYELAISARCFTACCLGLPLKEGLAHLQHYLRCCLYTLTPSLLLQEQQPAPQEELLYSDSVIAIDSAAALKQCETAISSCTACCLGLLLKEGTAQQHHYSTARGLSKAQLLELQKLKAGASAEFQAQLKKNLGQVMHALTSPNSWHCYSHSQRSTWPCDLPCDACGHISQ